MPHVSYLMSHVACRMSHARYATDLNSLSARIAEQKEVHAKLCRELSEFYASVNSEKTASDVDALVRLYRMDRGTLNQALAAKYSIDMDSSQDARDSAVAQGPLAQHLAWHKEVLRMLTQFKTSWEGRCKAATQLDVDDVALKYKDDLDQLNQLLRRQCHGTDLTSSKVEIDAVAQTLVKLPLHQVTARLHEFYRHLNPNKVSLVPQLAARYADDFEGLNASLRTKYGGLDLSSSPQHVIAFAYARQPSSASNGRASSAAHLEEEEPFKSSGNAFESSEHRLEEDALPSSSSANTAQKRSETLQELLRGGNSQKAPL
jgi:hypothetical protein